MSVSLFHRLTFLQLALLCLFCAELSTHTSIAHLLRTIALFVVSIATLRSCRPPFTAPRVAIIVLLQAAWFLSEVLFPPSVFLAALPRQTHRKLFSILQSLGPSGLFLLMASCFTIFTSLHKSKSKYNSNSIRSESPRVDKFTQDIVEENPTVVVVGDEPSQSLDFDDTGDSAGDSIGDTASCDGEDTTSLTASLSSTDLFPLASRTSGASTPCGHCSSPKSFTKSSKVLDRASEHFGRSDIYLAQHTLDTNESVLFVYKRLKPIKTRIEEEAKSSPPIPPPSYSYPNNPLKVGYQYPYHSGGDKLIDGGRRYVPR